jgi:hypothetical protein
MEVTWFRHSDEHRNELLRYGFMRLAKVGRVRYREVPLSEAASAGFSPSVTTSLPHNASVLLVCSAGNRLRCLVDSEDSFYWMSSLISEVDLYLCAGFNADFFRGKEFPRPNDWQSEDEVIYYRNSAVELVDRYGAYFGKVEPYVPIGPNLGGRDQIGAGLRKIRNARHKIGSRLSDGLYWQLDYEAYSRRYGYLLALRHAQLKYDVVLNDSLWGWPARRISLHNELDALKDKFVIQAKLSWAPPVSFDASDRLGLCSADFPRIIGQITDYEEMLASSRLGIFATGFHWGWRSIMTLTMLFGIPVLTDRLLLQPWFDLKQFDLTFNDADDWSCIADTLKNISAENWHSRRQRNARMYDTFMAPEAVASYVMDTVRRHLQNGRGRENW